MEYLCVLKKTYFDRVIKMITNYYGFENIDDLKKYLYKDDENHLIFNEIVDDIYIEFPFKNEYSIKEIQSDLNEFISEIKGGKISTTLNRILLYLLFSVVLIVIIIVIANFIIQKTKRIKNFSSL